MQHIIHALLLFFGYYSNYNVKNYNTDDILLLDVQLIIATIHLALSLILVRPLHASCNAPQYQADPGCGSEYT